MSGMSEPYKSVHTTLSAHQRAVSAHSPHDVSIFNETNACSQSNFPFSRSHNTHHYLEFFKTIRQCIANDTLPSLLDLVSEQQAKYDEIKKSDQMKKQSDANETSQISSESNQFKKLKNDANDWKQNEWN